MTLYEKTNNPLNIRFNKDNNWKGQTTTLRGFVRLSGGLRTTLQLHTQRIQHPPQNNHPMGPTHGE